MIETADIVAARYGMTREAQDALAVESQRRTAAAQEAGRFDAEMAPITVTMDIRDKETGAVEPREVTVSRDECNRPGTTAEALAGLSPVRGEDQFVTAGNASQLSDGAAALVMMSGEAAAREGAEPPGRVPRLRRRGL